MNTGYWIRIKFTITTTTNSDRSFLHFRHRAIEPIYIKTILANCATDDVGKRKYFVVCFVLRTRSSVIHNVSYRQHWPIHKRKCYQLPKDGADFVLNNIIQ